MDSELREEYEKYSSTLWQRVMKRCEMIIEDIKSEMLLQGQEVNIIHYESRIKAFDSMVNKFKKKFPDDELDFDTIKKNIRDIIGIRVEVLYLTDIDIVKEAISNRGSIYVVEEKNYIASPKTSGYRALHLCTVVDFQFLGESKKVPVEFQLMTTGQYSFAIQEHSMHYKGKYNGQLSSKEISNLREIADDTYAHEVRISEMHKRLINDTENVANDGPLE